jgi:3'-5' exoribonuclease
MLEQKSLKSLATKDKVEHFLLLTNFSVKSTKAGKEYLDLELRDQSILINAKMWDGFQSIIQSLSPGIVVKILGTMDEFNSQPQLKIERIRSAVKEDNVSTADFLPKSQRPLKEMESELNNIIDQIKNLHLKELLKILLAGENFQKYKKVPAGKAWHHAYIGGLLEHTLEIVKICDLMCEIHGEINKDLLITGAILHDMGKIEELEYESGFDYTDKGKLLGHIVIAANLIEKAAGKLENFPEDLKNQLIHLVLSHQGKLEYASPVTPKTLEAIVLYHADELSAKTNAYKGAIIAEFDSENSWTRFLPLAETSLFIPKSFPNNDEFKETLF